MFAEFRKLSGTAGAPLPDADARLALCALLVRIARSDNHYARQSAPGSTRSSPSAMRSTPPPPPICAPRAEALEAEAPDTVRFTRDIKDAVPYEDRRAVIQSIVVRCAGRWGPRR